MLTRALIRTDDVATLDLAPLPREGVDTLLHLALGGPLDGAAAARLWATTKGNVLALHELVVGAVEGGALVDEGWVWSLDGSLVGTVLRRELVEARLSALPDAGRRAREALAEGWGGRLDGYLRYRNTAGMRSRVTRAERTEQTRAELLTAALDVFVKQGYHGATLDQIALAAGYTKGVVYSRFESKADLFLAMLEARIDARAEQNLRLADGLTGVDGLVELIQRLAQVQRTDLPWALLLIEFRAHAARHPDLTVAYARLHGLTIERLASLFAHVVDNPAGGQATTLREAAQVLLGIGSGASLEQAVDSESFPPRVRERLVRGLVGGQEERT